MLERIADMPAGSLGFEVIGEADDDDWEETVEPVIRREMATGAKLRLLYLIGARAHEVDADAMSKEVGFRARHASSYERVAVVSDEDWLRPALATLSFLMPGKAKGFRVADLDAAKTWLSET